MGNRTAGGGNRRLYAYERSLAKAGLEPVAGADEAGRGACAGPLVVGAVVLPLGRRGVVAELADSKLLTPAARERVYHRIVACALAWTAVVIPARDVDRLGLHKANLEGMRRAIACLSLRPSYVLTDGFPVAGIGAPGLAVWKGDQVAACIAAASVIAKVTRDRMMCELHDQYPAYGFVEHKGYVTKSHQRALVEHGPCAEHRRSFVNVRAAGQVEVIDTSDLDDQMRDNGDVRDVDLIEIAAEA
jgi:ribonuclease HII